MTFEKLTFKGRMSLAKKKIGPIEKQLIFPYSDVNNKKE